MDGTTINSSGGQCHLSYECIRDRTQVKDGGLWVGRDATAITNGGGAGLIVENGNVGIGTPDPKTKLDVNGPVRVGQYSTKPTCDANTKGSIVFDTTNDKPYVCAASGVWKPLDSDGDKDGLIASFDDNDNAAKSASSVYSGNLLLGNSAYSYSGGVNGTWQLITGTYTPPRVYLRLTGLAGLSLAVAQSCRSVAGDQAFLVSKVYNGGRDARLDCYSNLTAITGFDQNNW